MMRRAARQLLAALVVRTRLLPVVRRGESVVLRYCRVAGTREAPVPRAVTEEAFEAQLRFLTSHCHVVPVQEIVEAVVEGRPLPRRAVAITFDGGYEDNGSAAFPLLKQHGVPATFFVAAGWVETHDVLWWDRVHAYVRQASGAGLDPRGYDHLPRPVVQAFLGVRKPGHGGPEQLEEHLVAAVGGLALSPEDRNDLVKSLGRALGADDDLGTEYDPMNWEQLAILRDGGMAIGSHAVSDARLTAIGVERAFEELAFSKKTLEKKLGVFVDLVAYPEGFTNLDVADLAEEAGYRAAFTTQTGPVRPGDPRFALRRMDVPGGDYRGAWGSCSGSVFGLHLRRVARSP
jgi:peptidoglycan/xylan/chitin deacetylase (PgdA/CDA1 family)